MYPSLDYGLTAAALDSANGAISLGILVNNLDEMAQLLQQIQQIAKEAAPKLRLKAGLLLRSTKEMWLTTLIVAVVCLSRKQVSSHDGDGLYNHALGLYEFIVGQMNLDECWKTKPLMNGKDLIRILGLKNGPEVGIYMEEQVKWTLTNPQGTIKDLEEHLRASKRRKNG